MSSNTKVKLGKVKVVRMQDENPDLSFLGRYSMVDDANDGEITIDREARGDMTSSGEYKYFIAATEYYEQDYERMISYNNQQWCMLGIKAEAEVFVPTGQNGFTIQVIRSGGLWGVESDAGESDLKEIEDEQIEDLKQQLKALGIKLPETLEVVREE